MEFLQDLIVLVVLLTLAYFAQSRCNSYQIFRVALIFLMSFIALRNGYIATDHDGYADFYSSADAMSFQTFSSFFEYQFNSRDMEFGYLMLNIICKNIGLSETTFFFVIALLVNGLAVRYVYRLKYPFLSFIGLICANFLFGQANLVRQYIAAVIIFSFIDCLSERKWLKYVLGVLLASTVHLSALLFLVLIPLCFINTDRGNIILQYVSVGALAFSLLVAFGIINLDFLFFLDLSGGLSRYQNYIIDDENRMGTSFSASTAIIRTGVAVYILAFRYWENIQYAIIIVFSAIIVNISLSLPNASRLFAFFSPLFYMYMVQYICIPPTSSRYIKTTAIPYKWITICLFLYIILATYLLNPKISILNLD